MKEKVSKTEDDAINSSGVIKSTVMKMIKKSPGDLFLNRGLVCRESDLNSIVSEIEFLERPEVKVMETYLSFSGAYHHPLFMFSFNQKIFFNELISGKTIKFHLTNDTLKADRKKNSIKINLNKIIGFDNYLKNQKDINILKELTLDSIEIKNGLIIFSAENKMDITVKEDFINYIIQEELMGKYGLEMLNITLKDGYINIIGKMVHQEFEVSFNKNVKIIKVDLYIDKYIEIEFDEMDSLNDKIESVIHFDRIKKVNEVMENNLFKYLIDKMLFNKNIHIKLNKEKKIIVFSHK